MEKILLHLEPMFFLLLLLTAFGSVLVCSHREFKSGVVFSRFYPLILIPVLLAFYLRSADLPVRHMTVFDEYTHMGMAETLALSGKLCELKKGSSADPEVCGISSWPGGYHTALAAWLRFSSRDREIEASAFNFFLVLLTFFALQLAAREVLGKTYLGFLAGFFMIFSWPYVCYSFSAETGVFSSFLVISSLLAFNRHIRQESDLSALLLASLVCMAVLTRYENILLPVFLVFSLYVNKKSMRLFWGSLPLILISVLIYILHIFYARQHIIALNVPQVSQFLDTLVKNILFWFNPKYSDIIISTLAAIGTYKLLKEKKMLTSAFFVAYLAVYSLAVPSFTSGLDMGRFALTLTPLYCLMAAAGFQTLTIRFYSLKGKKYVLLPAAIVILSCYLVQKTIAVKKTWDDMPDQKERKGRLFLMAVSGIISREAYFLTDAPTCIAFGTGRKAALFYHAKGIKAPLALLKDRFWYITTRQYPLLEMELNKQFNFSRVAIMNRLLPESENNYSLYLLDPPVISDLNKERILSASKIISENPPSGIFEIEGRIIVLSN